MVLIEESLAGLYRGWCGADPVQITRLPGSGSGRIYFRITGSESVIGAYNDNVAENHAFFTFTIHFQQFGIPVPAILAADPEQRIYLLTDLGDMTLFRLLTGSRGTDGRLSGGVKEVYRKAVARLPEIQVTAGRTLDYRACYPRSAFDRQSMMWDLNYFKYHFLKLTGIPFDEQSLEDDFNRLCDQLLEPGQDFFLFRDFQSRNIMVVNGEPWFIDYQGGRRGALHYDIASLLYDGKANLSPDDREELLEYYLDILGTTLPMDRKLFRAQYPGFVLIRILQALGAYGFRGYFEKKAHFLQSIPFALRNLHHLRLHTRAVEDLPALAGVIDRMTEKPEHIFDQILETDHAKSHKENEINTSSKTVASVGTLTVSINSFSYKRGLPDDPAGHGGGFVFDCRALPNPGRYPEYAGLTGRDQPVIQYLENEPAVAEFLQHVFALAGQSVRTYQARGFEHLMISFGCTGGQHRSVYCATQLAENLKRSYPVTITLHHREL